MTILLREMNNVSALYESHRLYVYHSCMVIFHRLFVDQQDTTDDKLEPIEDIMDNVQNIFSAYPLDSIYYHLNLVFEFLKFEYYNHYKVYRKAEKYYEEVNDAVSNLITNYTLYTYPAQFLISKLQRHLRLNDIQAAYDENEALLHDFEVDKQDVPTYVTYTMYCSISCYYVEKYEEGSKLMNNLLNEISLKKYPYIQMEIKIMLALQYCMLGDIDLFNQLINSIQRQVRMLGKENCEHILWLSKVLKLSISESKKNKAEKIKKMIAHFEPGRINHFSPSQLIKLDDDFVGRLTSKMP